MSTTIITDAEALAFLRLASTVVDADSAITQKVLKVTATINFAVGDEVIIGRGTVREEIGIIATIQSGVSLTMTVNLTFAHTAVQADTVECGYQDAEIISGMNLAIDKLIKSHCGRCFNLEEDTIELLDGDGSRELWLSDYPIENLLLYIDGDWEFGEDTLVDDEDYVLYPETGLIYYRSEFPIGHRNVKAIYDKGFADENMPEDLKLVCKMEVKLLYSRWKEDSQGLTRYSVAGISKDFESTLSQYSLMILDENYVKMRS